MSLEVVKKIINAEGSVEESVRHVTFGPIVDVDWFYFELSLLLEDMLRSIKRLQSLTWKTNHVVGPSFASLLYELHPSAKLRLILRDRKATPLSRVLLSSPQLHTLEIENYYDYDGRTRYTELPFIKECLNPSLRILRLDFAGLNYGERTGFVHWRYVRPSPWHFEWQKGDQFGPLEELRLKHDQYDFSRENCQLWARITSWSKLQRLDLGMGSPRFFFESLTGRAVNLKYLKFWISPARNRPCDLHPFSVGFPILAKFLSSITALRELDFGGHDIEEFEPALDLILENTGRNLRKLILQCITYGMAPWKEEKYVEILERTPGLGFFRASIKDDKVEGSWIGSKRYLSAWEKYDLAIKHLQIATTEREKQRRSRGTDRTDRLEFCSLI